MYTEAGKEIAKFQSIFRAKTDLEKQIEKLILQFEDESGLRIDSIRYERDITLPSRCSLYTDLSICITTEVDKEH